MKHNSVLLLLLPILLLRKTRDKTQLPYLSLLANSNHSTRLDICSILLFLRLDRTVHVIYQKRASIFIEVIQGREGIEYLSN